MLNLQGTRHKLKNSHSTQSACRATYQSLNEATKISSKGRREVSNTKDRSIDHIDVDSITEHNRDDDSITEHKRQSNICEGQ